MNIYLEAVIYLLAGLGVLLAAFKMLSDNIEKLANSGLKKMFNKTSNNRFIGVGIGAGATALIQSSSATTVMIVGFVNAGIMSLFQATAMIMGANIGTTITAQIAALGSLPIGEFAMLLSVIGIFTHMLAKKDKIKTVGLALCGLGMVFVGLDIMSSAMKIFAGEGSIIPEVLSKVNNPLLLLGLGIAFTALIQSSSAMTSILISMVAAGMSIGNSGNSILFVVLGTNIGTCITAILSSFGASTNAKRTSLIHLLFNFIGSMIFFVVLLLWPSFMDVTFKSWFNLPETQIAMFHTFFNVTCTLIFLPCIKWFVKIAEFLIPEKKKEVSTTFIDDRFLNTPAIALAQAEKETLRLGKMSMDTLSMGIKAFLNKDEDADTQLQENIKSIEELNQSLLEYLVKISGQQISAEDEIMASKLHQIINDFYREVEIADNMMKYTKSTIKQGLNFSDNVYAQIKTLDEKLTAQYENISKLFETHDKDVLIEVERIETEIDTMRSSMIKQHIARLEANECSPANSGVFINLVSNLERAGDHLNYIAQSFVE